MRNIRNFSIIAHIDHGKSTLADRILEITGTVPKDKMKEQMLDQMDIERERGITIKLQPVRIIYSYENPKFEISNPKQIPNPDDRKEMILRQLADQNDNDGESFEFRHSNLEFPNSEYILNLIDTPGHVDFTYEVSRSLASVEGAILLVDATKGIEAQTLAHAYLAIDLGLTLIPVINKVDMLSTFPSVGGERQVDIDHPLLKERMKELMKTFGFREDEILFASGKTGFGVPKILEAIVERIPAPQPAVIARSSNDEAISEIATLNARDDSNSFKALVFDSLFNPHLGVLAYVRVFAGNIHEGEKIKFLGTKKQGEALQVGYFKPHLVRSPALQAGEIGYIATGLKSVEQVRVGDTVVNFDSDNVTPVTGFKDIKPFVFASFYPVDGNRYEDLRTALAKMKLNDASLAFEPENSTALGFGFRLGFLGLLHMEVIQERLEREFNLELIATAPTVKYIINTTRGEEIDIETPDKFPDPSFVETVREPWISFTVFSPQDYIGAIMDLVNKKRGVIDNIEYLTGRAKVLGKLPLAELVIEFYDKLKSVSSGFASLDYELTIYEPVEAVKMDVLVAGDKVDALSQIVVKEKVDEVGKKLVEKLKEEIPRQNFEVAIQAAVGGRIVARADVKAYRKDVIAKLYGGDVTRKNKLLDKQKEGKVRMKSVGKVQIPQSAFLAILKL